MPFYDKENEPVAGQPAGATQQPEQEQKEGPTKMALLAFPVQMLEDMADAWLKKNLTSPLNKLPQMQRMAAVATLDVVKREGMASDGGTLLAMFFRTVMQDVLQSLSEKTEKDGLPPGAGL